MLFADGLRDQFELHLRHHEQLADVTSSSLLFNRFLIMYNLCVFTCIILIFVFHCTHVRISYVLNTYLLTYIWDSQTAAHQGPSLQAKKDRQAASQVFYERTRTATVLCIVL